MNLLCNDLYFAGSTMGGPTTDDGVACTVDACDEGTNEVTNTPTDSMCDNDLYCDGVETCDAVSDCQAGTSPVIDDGVPSTVAFQLFVGLSSAAGTSTANTVFAWCP